jgi:hypothetical protein
MSLLKVGLGYGGLVLVRLRSRESDEKRKRRDQREPVKGTSFYTFSGPLRPTTFRNQGAEEDKTW